MQPKKLLGLMVFGGSMVGAYIPMLWGAGVFSMQSVVGGTMGAAVGIWASFKLLGY